MLGLVALSTIQTIATVLLFGIESPEAALRLWSTCLMWIALVSGALTIAPMFAIGRPRILQTVRVVAAIIGFVAVMVLWSLAREDRMEDMLLYVGAAMAVVGWSGTFSVGWFMSRTQIPLQNDPVD